MLVGVHWLKLDGRNRGLARLFNVVVRAHLSRCELVVPFKIECECCLDYIAPLVGICVPTNLSPLVAFLEFN